MRHRDDLPKRLGRFFNDSLPDSETAEKIFEGWNKMSSEEQGELVEQLSEEPDIYKRLALTLMKTLWRPAN